MASLTSALRGQDAVVSTVGNAGFLGQKVVIDAAVAAGVKHSISCHSLRHTYVTTMLDAGVSLRDVQIAARHADPRTTIRYDRARNTLDRHGNYVLAAFMGGA